MNTNQLKKIKLPKKPGVYFFYKGKDILYVGKATSLSDRVKSYFGKDPEGKSTSYGAGLMATRGLLIVQMVNEADNIKWQQTDSVLEALILEANLIKKHQPKYNTKEKDNKSFNYVCITKEEIPKVIVIRGRNLNISSKQEVVSSKGSIQYQATYGPFPNGMQLRDAMKIIRRIFPFIDMQSSKKNNVEFYHQLGLIPDIGATTHDNTFQKVLGSPHNYIRPDHFEKQYHASLLEYKKNIKNLNLFFQGKKKIIVSNFKKQMLSYAKKKEFEKAGEIKKRIFALEHINDVALIKSDISQEKHFPATLFRIEAYDIAHMAGSNMVGVMTVIENGELEKGEYKKFIIRTQSKSNDTGALEEVLSRRLRHTEWGLPSLIVMDGGTAQINVAKSVLNRYQFKIPVVSVVKDDKHKAKAIMGDEIIIKKYKKEILLINTEAHRFAIAFHKLKRNKNFLK
ncbi:MAG: GIY-YIG nuclease family protein [Candidatus Pacebacteria bacterium]|nr:GIY-YIG nuclease family protein [Candidatus Paceibacterota bacterium]